MKKSNIKRFAGIAILILCLLYVPNLITSIVTGAWNGVLINGALALAFALIGFVYFLSEKKAL